MTVDISRLSPPDIIVANSYDTILAAMKTDLITKNPSLEAALAVDSEPVTQQLQVAAYREFIIRQEFNDRAKGMLLAYATGNNLDHLGETYYNTPRKLIYEEDLTAVPPVAAIYESDDDYRARLLIAVDSYSTAGPEAAYRYHVLSAGAVKDVSVISPTFDRLTLTTEQEAALPTGAQVYVPVDDLGLTNPTPASVVITVLSHDGDGTPTPELLAAVTEKLNDDVRPLTDNVIVQAPTTFNYTVNAALTVYAGFNQGNIQAAAQTSLDAWIDSQHMLGRDITVTGIKSALLVPGVHDITLNYTPDSVDLVTNLIVADTEVAYCTGTTVVIDGVGG